MNVARELFRCDFAAVPEDVKRNSELHDITSVGPNPNLQLAIRQLDCLLLSELDDVLVDFIRLANYVYLADQLVSRGSAKDVYLEHWRRDMALFVPVSDPERWGQRAVQRALETALHFLTEDTWEFHFVPRVHREARQLSLVAPEEARQLLHRPDCAVVTSGGADSLCAAVDVVRQRGRRPILVSHAPARHLGSRQQLLAAGLRAHLGWQFPRLGVTSFRAGIEPSERTQRARGFLYASLGSALARQLGLDTVYFCDNGVVSLNLPINHSIVGAQASRSTHPRFLEEFNGLLRALGLGGSTVENSLWNKTRAEALGELNTSGCADLLLHTVSCARARGLPSGVTHCGHCSQCIDRRFGVIGAGLEGNDPIDAYALDIFQDELPDGEARTMAQNYLLRARSFVGLSDDDFFREYPELHDCIPLDGRAERVAMELIALLRRHGEQIEGVLETMAGRILRPLIRGDVHPNSLLGLAVGKVAPAPEVAAGAAQMFCQQGEHWTLSYDRLTVHVEDVQGLHYIAYLLARPGEQVGALKLRQEFPGPRHGQVSSTDAARRAIDKAVRTAIARISAVHPKLGQHLDASVHPGVTCSYRPGATIAWST